jgi:hypothetical protein
LRLPKIPGEKYYTWVFASLLELIVIPVTFGVLSSIMLSPNFMSGVVAFSIFVIVCLYSFLLIYLSGFRHYSKNWKHLRMFYTSNTYIESFREVNNRIYNYTHYKIRYWDIYCDP